ncbi:MAG: sensor histidine kinase KdpD, partial [Verrucomicrobia bacterium]|nr:sensor histidine kinase KdpD [Verrucomicrobiota bacterium]
MSHDHDDDALRPNPDALLARMQRETAVAKRGRLKVFIGMCPGVGKTYAMLQAAQARQRRGDEVLVGIVETHGRAETEALLAGLAIAPRAQFEYKGATLNELDLDAILLWHPPVVIVDELAHTNAPGSRHPKRYQDVRELLDAGIDVFTTVNVQHLESRADTVYQITGVPVRETVPDSVLDLADEIVLVDLTPAQLRARLAEGKVYLGARAAAAAENFFKESNLTALREMALRYVAEHVDRDLRDLMRSEAIAGPWKTGDRLLVAISASPFSEKLIRYTRRLAATMEGSWIAAFIDTGQALDEPAQARLARHLTLARQLGAEVVSVPGTDVGETLLALARQHNVTQIVLGKPLGSRWRHWLTARASPVDWLIRHSGEIDIHMIRPEGEARGPRASLHFGSSRTGPREYVAATVVAGVVTGVCLLLSPFTGYWTIALIYLLAVVLASTRLGRGAMFYLAALSALLWDFLFIPPLYTFYIREVPDFVMLGTYFVVALVTGQFTTRLRERERAERWRQERATALYRLTRALAAGRSLDESLATAAELLKNSFGAEVAFWLRDTAGIAPHRASTFALDAKDESVAAWAFQKKQPAGRFTDTLPDAAALHLPLVAGQHAAGVLSLRLTGGALNLEQRELLDAFAAQLAVFLEKERAVEATRAAQLAAQSERLQKTLFDSVSHELKTPLTALAAALEQAEPDRSELQQAVRRLTRTVDHLLDVTRLESGLLRPAREWIDPGELAREAIGLARLDARAVAIHAPPQMAPVFVDAGLIEQALVVLLSNAENYAPIELSIRNENGAILFQVEDRGPGLAAGEEQKVFEKFYRGASQR